MSGLWFCTECWSEIAAGTKMVRANARYSKVQEIQGLWVVPAQSIMGATLKRRDGSGRVVCGWEPDVAVISFNVFCTGFGVRGVFTQAFGTKYQPTYDMYQSWKRVDGSTRYPVQFRTDRDKATVYQESRVFACKHVARAWAKRRYAELNEARVIGGLPR